LDKSAIDPHIERILLSNSEIISRVKEIAAQVSGDYRGKQLTIVTVLKGSVFFAADLLRFLTIDRDIDFVCTSSYIGANSVSKVQLVADLSSNPKGKNILLVEDIADTGLTLNYLRDNLKERGAASVAVCVLLDKPAARKVAVEIAYRGFTIEDFFVVGYGLDYEEKFRELPYIGVLKQSVYNNK